MMDELKQQFYEVMHKYQKPFSEEGVTANLTQWSEQKQGLLQLLRRHPISAHFGANSFPLKCC